MFDAETKALIARAPSLEGMNYADLPRRLTDAYATIVAARIRMQNNAIEQAGLSGEMLVLLQEMQRLASTNEALAAILDEESSRLSAAFVAASARHVVLMAEQYMHPHSRFTTLDAQGISPEVSATILFLIAEASADAAEMAKQFAIQAEDSVTTNVLAAIRCLANGQLAAILELPMPENFLETTLVNQGARSLYYILFLGLRALAEQLLGTPLTRRQEADPEVLFLRVKRLSVEPIDDISNNAGDNVYSTFPGPYHLASLLLLASKNLSTVALVNIISPPSINADRWFNTMRSIAKRRPYLWRNHRQAIDAGYLQPGVSAVMSFPTGAGKSTIAELKIAATLLQGLKAVFLAPTLALVDQTARALSVTFPQAKVEREPIQIDLEAEILPEISVMTPERCLALISFDPDVFQDVGLLVFDECHIMHPRDSDHSRRAIDAMLCVLNFTAIAPHADLLLLSAMMANSEEIAGWLENLTGRPCLSLSLSWKPTRQVRGCLVYKKDEIDRLKIILQQTRQAFTNRRSIPPDIAYTLKAIPLGFFCLHQTWQPTARRDYALLQLLDEQVILTTGTAQNGSWYLTPNGNKVAATLAAATAGKGFKTLIFTQTIPLANSACDTISEALASPNVVLNEEEKYLYEYVTDELGGADHAYLKVRNDIVLTSCACHHGLLLSAERRLHESIFKRPDGIKALVATSTLAQGMNLPSEIVIIAGDKRFDADANRMQQLEAHELLNAAGRAGRAGETSNGFVLVVPSKVVYFDDTESTIHGPWSELKAVFEQSDQCLKIDDPMMALLDQIQGATNISPTADYFLKRLPVSDTEGDAPARSYIGRSFAAYRARKQNNEAWLHSRIEAALALRRTDPDMLTVLTWQDRLAATAGVPVAIIRMLSELLSGSVRADATIIDWQNWLQNWFLAQPELLPQLIRKEALEGMFGTAYKRLTNDEERGRHIATPMFQMLDRWMAGETLAEMEQSFGSSASGLGKCKHSREFIMRIVPELAYIFGLPAQIYRMAHQQDMLAEMPASLGALGQCVREGFDTLDKLAVRHVRGGRNSRRAIHREYVRIQHYLAPAVIHETFIDVVDRVRAAIDLADAAS